MKKKLIALLLFVGCIPLLVSSIYFYNLAEEKVMEQNEAESFNAVEEIQVDVSNYLEKRMTIMKVLGQNPYIAKLDPVVGIPLLADADKMYPEIAIAVDDSTGMQKFRGTAQGLASVAQRQYFKDAIQGKDAISDVLISSTSNKAVIVLALPLREGELITGVIQGSVQLTILDKFLEIKANKENNGRRMFIVDRTGKILAHSDSIASAERKDISALPFVQAGLSGNVNKGMVSMKNENGEQVIINFIKDDLTGLLICSETSQELIMAPIKELRMKFITALMILGLIICIVGYFLANRIVRPIQAISEHAKEVVGGNLRQIEWHYSSNDEIGELGLNFNKMADTIQQYSQSLEQKVADRTRELQEKNNNIMESIDYAQRLQRAILPQLPQRLGLASEKCFVVWQPKDVVGGDMYWCRGDEHYALVAVVDCTGHGVPGALMSMTLGSILDGLPRELNNQKPSALLYSIHTRLKETLGQDKKDSLANDGADIALCLIDKKNNKILFAGAKLSFFVEHEGQITEYRGAKHSVGYSWLKEVVFEDCVIEVSPGSVIYMTTDGLLDQNSEEGKGGLGRKGFINFLGTIAGKPLTEQKEKVEELIATRLAKVEQRDDITVMGFEIY